MEESCTYKYSGFFWSGIFDAATESRRQLTTIPLQTQWYRIPFDTQGTSGSLTLAETIFRKKTPTCPKNRRAFTALMQHMQLAETGQWFGQCVMTENALLLQHNTNK